jgi:hypothetical protein
MAANNDLNDICTTETTSEMEADMDDATSLHFFNSLGLMQLESSQQSTIHKQDDFEVTDPSIQFFHSLGLQTNTQVTSNQNDQNTLDGVNTNQENILAQLDQPIENKDIDNSDVSLQFFHSLGLQTSQEASKRVDPNKFSKETCSEVHSDNTNELYDTLWSTVNADISFVDSLGLYWLPHSIDGNKDSLSNQKRTTENEDDVDADIDQPEHCVDDSDQTVDSKSDINDLDDCLNFFGFGSKTEVPGKQRWRLWNPSADDGAVLEHDVDDDLACHLQQHDDIADQGSLKLSFSETSTITKPTDALLSQLNQKSDSLDQALHSYKKENGQEIEDFEDEEIEKYRNKTTSNSAYYCTHCKRSISSQKLLARHLKSELHVKSCSLSLTPPVKKKQSFRDNETSKNKDTVNKHVKEYISDTSSIHSDKDDMCLNSSSDTSIIQEDKSDTIVSDDAQDVTSDGLIDCLSCGAKVQPHQFGKHLISHFHYHRSIGHEKEKSLILQNISHVVHQSPYQCQPCKFYCNWHRDLKEHVKNHHELIRDCDKKENSVFWCQVCIKILPSNKDLYNHLESDDHRDLISVVNRSIPTVLQKIELVACTICDQKFRLNIGLKKHMLHVHGLADFQLENHQLVKCKFCQFSSYKQKAVETHQFLVHREQRLEYTCNICRQSFASNEEIKRHR